MKHTTINKVQSAVAASMLELLSAVGQEHLLRFWTELSDSQRQELNEQLSAVDWDRVNELIELKDQAAAKCAVDRAVPPGRIVRIPYTAQERKQREAAQSRGTQVLQSGRVAVVLVAGGQGTRLGFPYPKGMYPIGPVTGKSLFQILAEKVVATVRRYGSSIPYLIMTSDATHDATLKWFSDNGYFGLDPADVYFFQQGCLPVMDAQTGKVLLADKGRLSLSADGHGGILAAMERAGLFEELRNRGVDYLFYHQVDNPLVRVCDPEFLGYHVLHNSEASTKAVVKRSSSEKVGVLVEIDGRTQIIEYSDLPAELSSAYNEDGSLRFWAGNTAIHIFNRSFLEYVAAEGGELPWHAARRKTPYIDDNGWLVEPTQENGLKFERFIFDALPLAERALVVETERAEEFAPLKNKDGESSPAEVKQCITAAAMQWLNAAGQLAPPTMPIEISPLVALTSEDLKERLFEELRLNSPIYLAADAEFVHFEIPQNPTCAPQRVIPR